MSTLSNWNKLLIIFTLIFCYIVIIARVANVSMYDNSKARDFYHGDGRSDKNAHSTAMYFFDFGAQKSYYLPVFDYKGNNDTSSVSVYTHYPALSDNLTAIYAKLFQTKNERIIRIIPVVLSCLFVLLIFYLLHTFYQDKKLASITGCILLLSNYFIFWADNLHKHQYEEFFKWLFVLIIYLYYENNRKGYYLLFLMVIFIINANISYEPILYMAIVSVGFSLLYDKKLFSKETILLGIAAVIGLSVHLIQTSFYFGNIHLALNDMKEAATLRTIGNETGLNELGRKLDWTDYLNIPNLIQLRIERVYLIPGFAFFFLGFLGLKKVKNENKKTFSILIILLIASISWFLLMTQHATVHCFTIRQFGIFYTLALGYGLVAYYELYQSKIKFSKLYLTLHYLFWVYIIAMAISQNFIDYFRYGLLYHNT
jgi:hypothetical protein